MCCRRVVDDNSIVTLLPLVVAVMSTMPTVLPLTVLIEPAAFRLNHALPFQTYRNYRQYLEQAVRQTFQSLAAL